MKKRAQWTLAALLMFSPLVAKDKPLVEISQIIPLTGLEINFIREFVSGMHPDVAIECREGTTLPISIFYNLGLFSLDYVPNMTVKVEKACYIRCVGKKAYFSQDLVKWSRADKFFKGNCNASIKIDEKTGILIETNCPISTDE
jgi:hypothetical protein